MTDNPLKALTAAGQAIWLDYLHQDILNTGELKRLIADDGLTGLTSNPSIFEKAIGDGEAYDARIAKLAAAGKTETKDLYEAIAIGDIQGACDQFRPAWDRLKGRDGYASLEVSPELANDTQATVDEARRRIREAIGLFIDNVRAAKIVDNVKLPADAKKAISAYAKLRMQL